MPPRTPPNPRFPDTRWTLVLQARESDPASRARALSDLCESYWPPVYAFIRSTGHSPADAEDLTQGFFAQLLEHDRMANADADRGKLRSFLLTSVKNYMTDEWRKDQRIKRGGGNTILSLNANDLEDRLPPPNPGHDPSPDNTYERQWALTLLDQVLKQLRKRYESEGKSQLFETLKPFLTPDAPKTTHADAAAALNMTESATKVATHRLRERYANILRNNTADTLGPGEDADAELQHLFSVFA